MSLDLRTEKGTALDRQVFTWRELAGPTYSKLDDDAFTRVRVLLLSGLEAAAVRFGHTCALVSRGLRPPLAQIRRVEHHQQTLTSWLHPADQSPLETLIALEQTAIEITAWFAQHCPSREHSAVYRFGMLEDVDHLYRLSALTDRVFGQDANNILQSYTDIAPGRPTFVQHRAPDDDLRTPYDRATALPLTKLAARTITALAHQLRDAYMTIGPTLADPVARMLLAEIASVEEQHVTQYECLADPEETWLEKWLLHECTEVYAYWSCLQQESNNRLKLLWARFVDYELGQLAVVKELMRRIEDRDPDELLPSALPDPIRQESQRDLVRDAMHIEGTLRASGTRIVALEHDPPSSLKYREQLGSEGSPSELVALHYEFTPGTELDRVSAAIH